MMCSFKWENKTFEVIGTLKIYTNAIENTVKSVTYQRHVYVHKSNPLEEHCKFKNVTIIELYIGCVLCV